jgi:glycosyltransferase involved in cell wall biosynthesis
VVIAGPECESGYISFLRDKARGLGVESRVLFPGALYGNAQKQAYHDATVFALPSRYENFGNTAGEAIVCGTPVLVTDRCGIAPLVDGRAGVVTSYDAKAIAQSLRDLLGNDDLYQRLRAGCPGVARELSWEGLVEQMQTIYEDVRTEPARAKVAMVAV